MRAVFILLILAYISSVSIAQDPQPKGGNNIFCYYNARSANRKAPFTFKPEHLDPFLCTHLIYAFAVINTNYDIDDTQDNFQSFHPHLLALKQRNPKLKIMISIGGFKDGSTRFGEITYNQTTREKFSENLVTYLRKYDLDGIDLNWQYPTVREGGKREDRENYVLLAQTIRGHFDDEALKTNKPRHILVVSAPQLKTQLPAYDIPSFNRYTDFILILSYVYLETHSDTVKHHSPLYPVPGTSFYEKEKDYSVDSTVNYYLSQADPEKVVLGLPPYGRSHTLADPNETEIGAEADGAALPAPYTNRPGSWAYFEICLKINQENYTVAQTKPLGLVGPHAFKGNQWVGYDDVDMIRIKTQYAKKKGLAGVMFYNLDREDYTGNACGQGPYPLIRAAKEELNKDSDQNEMKMTFSTGTGFVTDESNKILPRPTYMKPNVGLPAQAPQPKVGNNIFCYYSSRSATRKAPFNFKPEHLDPFLCTHLIYAFAVFGKNYDFDENDEFKAFHPYLMALKRRNPKLKIMVTAGGWRDGSTGFGEITYNQTTRERFAENLVTYLRKYNFDGIDLNWQHPTVREGGKPEDKENYVLLAQTIRGHFEDEAIKTNKPRHILAISITQLKKALTAYDIFSFNIYTDFIFILSYVYLETHSDTVKHHSPLYAVPSTSFYEEEKDYSVHSTINYFLSQADARKLVLGLPPYGRSYTLADPSQTDIGAEADGAGLPAPYTNRPGSWAYFEICLKIRNEQWTVAQTKPLGLVGPHAFKGNQWVGYDDVQMIRIKSRYAKERGLAGVMFFTLDREDFTGNACGQGPYPLIRAAKEELNRDNEVPMVFPTDPIPTSERPTRRPPVRNPVMMTTQPSTTHGYQPTTSGNNRQTDDPQCQPSEENFQPNALVDELILFVKKAGGMRRFCQILREVQTNHKTDRGPKMKYDVMMIDVPNLEPLKVFISNSSITIQALNIYGGR